MQTREWRYVDKSEWGPGPWQDEPDKMQWLDGATGLPCLIVRGPSGALCGYVGVSRKHPLYGVDYNARQHGDECDDGHCFHHCIDVDVHGGLTFSDKCHPGENEHGICHIVEPGDDDDVWWFGFDCAHYKDLCPRHVAEYGFNWLSDGEYRDVAYVRSEVECLAEQLAMGFVVQREEVRDG